MNNIWYLWYPLLEAIQQGYDTTKIHYRVKDRKFFTKLGDEQICYTANAHHISPLLEYMPLVVYDPDHTVKQEEKFARADINPYHRFGSIFDPLLNPERYDPNDLIICDIIAHMLAHIDRICGMSKRDFRLLLIMRELDKGCFGHNPNAFRLFNLAEKRAVAEALIMLYETENSLRCLDMLFQMIMTGFKVLQRNNEEVVFYNPGVFDSREHKKLQFLIKVFLPIDFPYVIHWRYTYGTVEHEKSMVLEEFVL